MATEKSMLKSILDTIDALVVGLDREGQITLFNRACERLTGYSFAEVSARRIRDFLLVPEEVADFQTEFAALWLGATPPGRESHWLTRDGRRRLIDWTYTIVHEGDDQGIVIATGIDLTERLRNEEQLRRQKTLYEQILDNLDVDITLLDNQMKFEYVSPKTVRDPQMRAWLIGKDDFDYCRVRGFSRSLAEQRQAWLRRVIETRRTQEMEETIETPEGGKKIIFRKISPVVGEAGEVIRIAASGFDITEHRRLDAERRELDLRMQHTQKLESLGVLAGGIAHDFNNLLTGILGYADLALLDLSPVSPARENIEQIELAARRAAELTRQMLAYSGKGKFAVQPIEINQVVKEMAHLLEVSVSKKCVLKYYFADHLPLIEADPSQLRQVIINLIINASEAIGENSGVIAIRTGAMECDRAYLSESYLDEGLPEGPYVYIEVSDTGCGMTEAVRARIFDPFFTTKFTGRGLGLAAVIGIVRGHRGAIKVYSEPGRGTTFKVLLPAATTPAEDARADNKTPAVWQVSGTVLVVDDEETVRFLARRMLEKVGFKVLLAGDGLQGLDLYRQHGGEIRLVIMDMTMPNMDGEETFRELRRIDPNVRVVLSSGYNMQEATDRFAGKGLAGFIQKPYHTDELLAVVREALES